MISAHVCLFRACSRVRETYNKKVNTCLYNTYYGKCYKGKKRLSRMSMGPQKASHRDYLCSGSWSSTCENPDRKGEVGTFQKLKGG